MSSTPLLEGRVSGEIIEILEFDAELGYSSVNSLRDARSESRHADVKTTSPEVWLAGVKNTESASGTSDASSENRQADAKTTSPEFCLAGVENTKSANVISDVSSEGRLADVKTTRPEVCLVDINNKKSEASISETQERIRDPRQEHGVEASDADKESWGKRLQTAISSLFAAVPSPEPRLPVCTSNSKDSAEIATKHQVLYAVGLMAPVPMLAAAAALKLFIGWWALVAGAAIFVWILASSGMVINQYGRSRLEQICARHMGHLGMLSTALLFSFFVFRAFFPDSAWVLVLLIILALLALGAPWVLVCLRADD